MNNLLCLCMILLSGLAYSSDFKGKDNPSSNNSLRYDVVGDVLWILEQKEFDENSLVLKINLIKNSKIYAKDFKKKIELKIEEYFHKEEKFFRHFCNDDEVSSSLCESLKIAVNNIAQKAKELKHESLLDHAKYYHSLIYLIESKEKFDLNFSIFQYITSIRFALSKQENGHSKSINKINEIIEECKHDERYKYIIETLDHYRETILPNKSSPNQKQTFIFNNNINPPKIVLTEERPKSPCPSLKKAKSLECLGHNKKPVTKKTSNYEKKSIIKRTDNHSKKTVQELKKRIEELLKQNSELYNLHKNDQKDIEILKEEIQSLKEVNSKSKIKKIKRKKIKKHLTEETKRAEKKEPVLKSSSTSEIFSN